jgi:hypothetical protein
MVSLANQNRIESKLLVFIKWHRIGQGLSPYKFVPLSHKSATHIEMQINSKSIAIAEHASRNRLNQGTKGLPLLRRGKNASQPSPTKLNHWFKSSLWSHSTHGKTPNRIKLIKKNISNHGRLYNERFHFGSIFVSVTIDQNNEI